MSGADFRMGVVWVGPQEGILVDRSPTELEPRQVCQSILQLTFQAQGKSHLSVLILFCEWRGCGRWGKTVVRGCCWWFNINIFTLTFYSPLKPKAVNNSQAEKWKRFRVVLFKKENMLSVGVHAYPVPRKWRQEDQAFKGSYREREILPVLH